MNIESFDHLPVLASSDAFIIYAYNKNIQVLYTKDESYSILKYVFHNSRDPRRATHRIDGPAVCTRNGKFMWYINDHEYLTEEEYWRTIVNEY